jgi:hypothetical protein
VEANELTPTIGRSNSLTGAPKGFGRSSAVIALVVAVLSAPFLAKPVHLDDPLFLWGAKQVLRNPVDFFGFDVRWYETEQPMNRVTMNPPLTFYLWAIPELAARKLGWNRSNGLTPGSGWSDSSRRNEIIFHLVGLAPSIACALGVAALARTERVDGLTAGLIAVATPTFLVAATTLMSDMTMTAFWIWSIVLLRRSFDRDSWPWAVAAGLLGGAAFLSKFFGLSLVGLFAFDALLAMLDRRLGLRGFEVGSPNVGQGNRSIRRDWGFRSLIVSTIIAVSIVIMVVVAYERHTSSRYGEGHFWLASRYAVEIRRGQTITVADSLMTTALFAGGCMAPAIWFAPRLRPPGGVRTIAGLFAFAAPVAWLAGLGRITNPGDGSIGDIHSIAFLHAVVFLATAGLIALLVVDETILALRTSRFRPLFAPAALIGVLYFGGVVNWTVNGRSLLPAAPMLGVLLARRLARSTKEESKVDKNQPLDSTKLGSSIDGETGSVESKATESESTRQKVGIPAGLLFPLALSLAVAFAVAWADASAANADRTAAIELSREMSASGEGRLFALGHWGFQWYAESVGAETWANNRSNRSPRDRLLRSSDGANVSLDPVWNDLVPTRRIVRYRLGTAGTVYDVELGVGWPMSVAGRLPYVIGVRTVRTYEVLQPQVR